MSNRSDYAALNGSQRRLARRVAKTGIAGQDQRINRAALAWSRRRATSGVVAALIFLFAAIAYFFVVHNVSAGTAALGALAATTWILARDVKRLGWLRGYLSIDRPTSSETDNSGGDHLAPR